jgi:tRNA (guanine37-N1)-methyltransferase
MKSLCIAVPFHKGEEVRQALIKMGLLQTELSIIRDQDHIYMPINEEADKEVFGYTVSEKDFEKRDRMVTNYKEILDIPHEFHSLLPSSYDVIGKLAIIKLHDELVHYKEDIAGAILKANKSLETIALDSGVGGEERVRKLEIIAGKRTSETIHKEYGIELKLDPSLVYFSPRLATERWRIAQMVEEGEIVIDMFCGVGPFSILIAKQRKPKKIYSIDINENAIHYLNKNIILNKVSIVEPIRGDSKVIVPNLEKTDRIIMNLPHSSFEFLETALSNIKRGGIIHYYEIIGQVKIEERKMDLYQIAEKRGMNLKIAEETEVHTYSPDSSLYCFDLQVEK